MGDRLVHEAWIAKAEAILMSASRGKGNVGRDGDEVAPDKCMHQLADVTSLMLLSAASGKFCESGKQNLTFVIDFCTGCHYYLNYELYFCGAVSYYELVNDEILL